jgi:hypothetical protein
MNGPNKLECLIVQGWKDLAVINTLIFQAYSYVRTTENEVT